MLITEDFELPEESKDLAFVNDRYINQLTNKTLGKLMGNTEEDFAQWKMESLKKTFTDKETFDIL